MKATGKFSIQVRLMWRCREGFVSFDAPKRGIYSTSWESGNCKSQRVTKISLLPFVLVVTLPRAIANICLILSRVQNTFIKYDISWILTFPWVSYYFHFTDKETEVQRLEGILVQVPERQSLRWGSLFTDILEERFQEKGSEESRVEQGKKATWERGISGQPAAALTPQGALEYAAS